MGDVGRNGGAVAEVGLALDAGHGVLEGALEQAAFGGDGLPLVGLLDEVVRVGEGGRHHVRRARHGLLQRRELARDGREGGVARRAQRGLPQVGGYRRQQLAQHQGRRRYVLVHCDVVVAVWGLGWLVWLGGVGCGGCRICGVLECRVHLLWCGGVYGNGGL